MPEPGTSRIAFAGTPQFAAIILAELLAAGVRPVLVLTQPDRPAGRGRTPAASAVKQLASAHRLAIAQPAALRTTAGREALTSCRPHLLIVAAYGLILPRAVLAAPTHGCVNVHASLLPRWRGAAPIERAIMAGDADTGVALMKMDAGLDTGPVFADARCPIAADDTGAGLESKLARLGASLLLSWLPALLDGTAVAHSQDPSLATYATKLTRADAAIDWRGDATAIAAQVRALAGRVSAEGSVGGDRVQLLEAAIHTGPAGGGPAGEGPAGEIIGAGRDGIVVRCGHGALSIQVLRVTSRGKGRALSAREACNGYPDMFAVGQAFTTEQVTRGAD